MKKTGKAIKVACVIGLLAIVALAGCNTRGPLRTGIRVRSEFLDSPFMSQGTGAPVPNVTESGIFIRYDGGPTGGSESQWNGVTAGDGIDDHPNAITGAVWNFSADFSTSPLPACGTQGAPGLDVPYPVAQLNESCYASPVL